VPSLMEVVRKYAEQGRHALLPAVDEIVQHGHLAEHLHDLLKGRIATSNYDLPIAYRHPNGFIKIRLASLRDLGWAVRLHMWAERSSDYDIHSHRWDFASRVLSGILMEDTYQLTASRGLYRRYRCSPSIEGRYALDLQGECDVELASRNRYHQGISYTRDAEVLHQSYTDSTSRAMTLFIQGPEREASTTVIRRSDSNLDRNVVAPRCTSLQVAGLLQEAAGLLAYD
jgi:hypothetical protein